MNISEGKKVFCAECEKSEIDVSKVFILGNGSKSYKGRYRQAVDVSKQLASHLFVVQFCKDIGLFIAWNLNGGKCRREIFSVKKEELIEIDDDEIHIIKKNVQYHGWGEEDVIAFKPEAVSKFLKIYIKPVINNIEDSSQMLKD